MSAKNTKAKAKKKPFNMYAAVHKNKKKFIGIICGILILTMVAGIFAQFAFM
ncbi:MAG: hypothetical protein ACRCWY_09785 [Cellulosilyticaceae bacterium]